MAELKPNPINASQVEDVTQSQFASHRMYGTHRNDASQKALETQRSHASHDEDETHHDYASQMGDVTHVHIASPQSKDWGLFLYY